jgi:hypothetical protein
VGHPALVAVIERKARSFQPLLATGKSFARDDNSVVPASASAGNLDPTIELSSRPERSVVEGPAVSSPGQLD